MQCLPSSSLAGCKAQICRQESWSSRAGRSCGMGSVPCPSPSPESFEQHMSSRAISITPACIITTAGIIKCSLPHDCLHLLPPGPRPWLHWKELQEGFLGHAVGLRAELWALSFPFLQQGRSFGFLFRFLISDKSHKSFRARKEHSALEPGLTWHPSLQQHSISTMGCRFLQSLCSLGK